MYYHHNVNTCASKTAVLGQNTTLNNIWTNIRCFLVTYGHYQWQHEALASRGLCKSPGRRSQGHDKDHQILAAISMIKRPENPVHTSPLWITVANPALRACWASVGDAGPTCPKCWANAGPCDALPARILPLATELLYRTTILSPQC